MNGVDRATASDELQKLYAGFAAAAKSAAAIEPLENVRIKHLSSAASWERLAAVDRHMNRLRDRRAAEDVASVWMAKKRPVDPLFVATTK